jgi:hypothetical protein
MKQNKATLSRDHVRQALENYLNTYFGKGVEVKKYSMETTGEINVEVVYER